MSSSPPPQAVPHDVWERPFVTAHARWCRDFVLELRLRGAPGPVIGERLAEVEGHCTETGESPSEAFGEPRDYAARIDQDSDPVRVSGVWTVTAAAAAQVVSVVVGTSAVAAWARGQSLTYNLVQVVCFGLTLLLLLSLPLLLRPVVRHPWTIGAPVFTVVPLLAGGAALSARADLPPVAQLPAPTVAVGLFVTVLVLARVTYRVLARDAEGDLVTSPLAAPVGPSTAAGGRARRVALVPACLIPAAYLAFGALSWLIA